MDKTFNLEASSVVHAVTKVAAYVHDVYKGAEFKKEAELKLIYGDYLKHVHKNNTHIKTLLHRNPKALKELYEPMDLIYKDNNSNERRVEYQEIIPEIINNSKIIVQGVGGLGKSLLLKSLFLRFLEQKDFIPILIDLKTYQGEPFIDFLFQTMQMMRFKNISKEEFAYTLEAGHYVFLLDSFDEISSEFVSQATKEILSFSELYDRNKYLVASRPYDANRFTAWKNFFEYDLSLLTPKQMKNLIGRINPKSESDSDAFVEALVERFKGQKEYLGNPLLLTVLLLTYNKYGELPTDYLDFYERAYTVLFQEHDYSKDGYKRGRATPLTESQFKKVLACIAGLMVVDRQLLISRSDLLKLIEEAQKEIGNINFPPENFIEDAVQSLCLFVKEGTDYKFIHKNFHEFFAGKYFASKTDDFLEKNLVRYILDERIDLDHDRTLLATIYDEARERHDQNIILPLVKHYYREDFNEFLLEFSTVRYRNRISTAVLHTLYRYLYRLYGIDVRQDIFNLIAQKAQNYRYKRGVSDLKVSVGESRTLLVCEIYFTLEACRQRLTTSPKPSDDRFA